jgi:hypothetical protein
MNSNWYDIYPKLQRLTLLGSIITMVHFFLLWLLAWTVGQVWINYPFLNPVTNLIDSLISLGTLSIYIFVGMLLALGTTVLFIVTNIFRWRNSTLSRWKVEPSFLLLPPVIVLCLIYAIGVLNTVLFIHWRVL